MQSMQAANQSMLMNLHPDVYTQAANNSMFMHPSYPFVPP